MTKKKAVKTCLTRATAVLLSMTMICADGICTQAAQTGAAKEENIYVGLDHNGSVEGIYVVNAYRPAGDMQITDYGKYDSVKNLTTDGEISLQKDQVTFQAREGWFCYQGNLRSKEIPWKISISWELDGKETEASGLAGKSGALKIRIHVEENEKAEGDFYDQYMLRMIVPMDMNRCSGLEAPGASVENVGTTKRLSYDILSGRERDILISADVLDFEMEAITFRGFPMALYVDEDFFSMEALYERMEEAADLAEEADEEAADLSGGTDALQEGADGLKDSLDSLKKGLESYAEGTRTLGDGVEELSDGADELADGTQELHDGVLTLLDGANELRDGLQGENGAAAGARKLAEGAEKLEVGAKQLGEGIGALVGMIRSMGNTEELDAQAERILQECMAWGLTPAGNSPREKLETLSGLLGNMLLAYGAYGIRSGQEDEKQETETLEILKQTEETESETAEEEGTREDQAEKEENAGSGPETDEEREEENDGGHGSDSGNGSDGAGGTDKGNGTNEGSSPDDGKGTDEENGPDGGSGPDDENGTEEKTGTEGEGRTGEESESEKSVRRAGSGSGTIPADDGGKAQGGGTDTVADRRSLSEVMPVRSRLLPASLPAESFRRREAAAAADGIGELFLLSNTGEGDRREASGTQAGQLPAMPPKEGLIRLKTGVDQLLGSYLLLENISARFGAPETTQQLEQLAEGASALSDGVSGLADGAQELAEGMERISDGTGQLADGVSDLAEGSEELSDGTRELADGVSDLFDGAGELMDASDDLLDGTLQLTEGSESISDSSADLLENVKKLQEKNAELRENSEAMDGQLGEEIDGLLRELSGTDYNPASFVSDKNTNVLLVCFSMKTQEIRIPERKPLRKEEEKLTFWQRLLELFRLGGG